MSSKWGVKPEQAEVLMEFENIIGESIPILEELEEDTFGVKIKEDNVIGLLDNSEN